MKSGILRIHSMVAVAAAQVAAPPAMAQFVQGPYVATALGLGLLTESELRPDAATTAALAAAGYPSGGHLGFRPGATLSLSLGWGFGNGLRAEIEAAFRRNAVDSAGGAAGGPHPAGRQEAWGVMGNVLLDLAVVGPVIPYVGFGLGYVATEWRGISSLAPSGLLRMRSDDADGRFAYQGIAGFAFPLDLLPGLALTAEYRFLGTVSPRFSVRYDNPTTNTVVARGTVEADTLHHAFLVGFRYALPPAGEAGASGRAGARGLPPGLAQREGPRSVILLFDWNSADLSPRSRHLIAEAARQAGRQGGLRLEVTGRGDPSGQLQSDPALSRRRAEAVIAELHRHGISREAILLTGLPDGPSPLPVTTALPRSGGPQRIEIVLR